MPCGLDYVYRHPRQPQASCGVAYRCAIGNGALTLFDFAIFVYGPYPRYTTFRTSGLHGSDPVLQLWY